MSKWRILFRQQESDDLDSVHGDQTLRAVLRQEVLEHRFRVRDSGRKTLLVQLEQGREILRIGLTDGHTHGPDSRPAGTFSLIVCFWVSAVLKALPPAPWVLICSFCCGNLQQEVHSFSGGACANRSSSPRGFCLRVSAVVSPRRRFLPAIFISSRLIPFSSGNALRFCELRGDSRGIATAFGLARVLCKAVATKTRSWAGLCASQRGKSRTLQSHI